MSSKAETVEKSFFRKNIDRAIVLTQFNLNGGLDWSGSREKKGESAKSFDGHICNFMAYAAGVSAGFGILKRPTDKNYVFAFDPSDGNKACPYDDYLAMCKRLKNDCDSCQEAAIKLIIKEIAIQQKKMEDEVANNKRDSSYVLPLLKDNYWGVIIFALSEAFEVELVQDDN